MQIGDGYLFVLVSPSDVNASLLEPVGYRAIF